MDHFREIAHFERSPVCVNYVVLMVKPNDTPQYYFSKIVELLQQLHQLTLAGHASHMHFGELCTMLLHQNHQKPIFVKWIPAA